MSDYYLDVCTSRRMADFREAEHKELKRKVVAKWQAGFAQCAKASGTPTQPDILVRLSQEGDDLWVVIAKD